MNQKRVVVTGLGLVTPLGIGIEPFWNGLLTGVRVIRTISRFDASPFSTRIAAEITEDIFDPSQYMDRKEARRNARFIQFAIAATRHALEHAQFAVTPENAERVGVMIGSGIGGVDYMDSQVRVLDREGPDRLSPFLPIMMIADMAAGIVSIMLGAKGPNSCVVTACATGANAIGDAARLIQRGDVDVMIAGGTEAAVVPVGIGSFCAARAMSTRNDDPAHASRPFDAERDGFVMGEGAGILILESYEHAVARGATMIAEIKGYGMCADAYHLTQPDPEGDGAFRSMRNALRDAGLEPSAVDYINAHGTSTRYNDMCETRGIKRLFGDYAYQLGVSSTKSVTGHLLGAAGAVEAAVCALAIQHQTLPPTINYEFPDPECDLDYVPNEPRPAKVDVTLSNSFGFGGHNASLVITRVT